MAFFFRNGTNSLKCPCFDRERGEYPKFCAIQTIVGEQRVAEMEPGAMWKRAILSATNFILGRDPLLLDGVVYDCQTSGGCYKGKITEELVPVSVESGVPDEGEWIVAESRNAQIESTSCFISDP